MRRTAAAAALLAAAGACAGPNAPERFVESCTPSASAAVNGQIPLLQKPFDGEFPLGTPYDHDLPIDGHKNGFVRTTCGTRFDAEVVADGHAGYDFMMPVGTPLLAAASGEVLVAGLEPPRFCEPLGRTVQALLVAIAHRAPDGEIYATVYGHMDVIAVKVGDQLAAGMSLGTSGNTGCSGSPHLHFDVLRKLSETGIYTSTDPYGWQGAGADPWAVHPQGTPSRWLWKDGQAPRLFK
jgi:murein DD-endopeptidase MepM/ murein hydrolase activator NlpD